MKTFSIDIKFIYSPLNGMFLFVHRFFLCLEFVDSGHIYISLVIVLSLSV
jgi:hypothetical protein